MNINAAQLEREKLALQKLAAQRLGINVDIQRITVSELTGPDQAAIMLALPVDPDDNVELQEPNSGAFYVIWGLTSPFDTTATV